MPLSIYIRFRLLVLPKRCSRQLLSVSLFVSGFLSMYKRLFFNVNSFLCQISHKPYRWKRHIRRRSSLQKPRTKNIHRTGTSLVLRSWTNGRRSYIFRCVFHSVSKKELRCSRRRRNSQNGWKQFRRSIQTVWDYVGASVRRRSARTVALRAPRLARLAARRSLVSFRL